MYKVVFNEKALKSLKKLDKYISKKITKWILENLNNTENPREHGKALTGNFYGLWRYRVENYRIIAEIQEEKVIILIVDIGHRKEIYK